MGVHLEEQAIRQEYRVTGDPSWRVLRFWKGDWVVAYYCSTEDGAYRMLEKCVQRALQWSQMTEEQRLTSILR